MKKLAIPLLILGLFFLSLSSPAAAADRPDSAKLEAASAILYELMNVPEQSIPVDLLRNAYGIAVFPGVLNAAFIGGARFGSGALVVRHVDGTWSNPTFVSIGGGSFGLQAGIQSSDLILVFKTRRSIDELTSGRLTLGASASVAAGPIGRSAEAATDIQLASEILSYSKTRGLFAGVSVQGAVLSIDRRANRQFYGMSNPLLASSSIAPGSARRFVCVVTKFTDSPSRVC